MQYPLYICNYNNKNALQYNYDGTKSFSIHKYQYPYVQSHKYIYPYCILSNSNPDVVDYKKTEIPLNYLYFYDLKTSHL